jgi:hypothetical protein
LIERVQQQRPWSPSDVIEIINILGLPLYPEDLFKCLKHHWNVIIIVNKPAVIEHSPCYGSVKMIRFNYSSEDTCEGLPGVYSTIWRLCYKTNELKKRKEKRATGRAKWARKRGNIGAARWGIEE